MALPTYLELVNDVLVRLREPEVTTVQANTLSKLIGKLVNDSKRQVEDAYNWSALTTTSTVSTVAGTSLYTITGSSNRFRVDGARNVTKLIELNNIPVSLMEHYQTATASPQQGSPSYYCFKGIDANGDSKVELFPVPDGVYTLNFDLYVPSGTLVNDTDTIKVPYDPVVAGAYARALVERGEDGGLNSSEAYALYRGILADYIANEASRFVEGGSWEAV
jgi:hypothetical protein